MFESSQGSSATSYPYGDTLRENNVIDLCYQLHRQDIFVIHLITDLVYYYNRTTICPYKRHKIFYVSEGFVINSLFGCICFY